MTRTNFNLVRFAHRFVTNVERDYMRLGVTHGVKGSYRFVPSSTSMLNTVLYVIKKQKICKRNKIIDAGCGISPVLLLLHLLGYKQLYGYDICPTYINYLKECLDYSYKDEKIKLQDIVTANYSGFKLIYTFNPLCGAWGDRNDTATKFYNQVLNTMDIGSYFMECSGQLRGVYEEKKYKSRFRVYTTFDAMVIKRIK